MLPGAEYKPVMSVSIPPERRHVIYTSLERLRQRYPFITKSGLVVRAVLDATQMEQQLIELFAHLLQAVQITQQGSVYLWQCPQSRLSPNTARSHQASLDDTSGHCTFP